MSITHMSTSFLLIVQTSLGVFQTLRTMQITRCWLRWPKNWHSKTVTIVFMSNFVVALMLSAGVSGWVYSQVQRRNGGITQKSLIAAGVAGVISLIVMWTVLLMIF